MRYQWRVFSTLFGLCLVIFFTAGWPSTVQGQPPTSPQHQQRCGGCYVPPPPPTSATSATALVAKTRVC